MLTEEGQAALTSTVSRIMALIRPEMAQKANFDKIERIIRDLIFQLIANQVIAKDVRADIEKTAHAKAQNAVGPKIDALERDVASLRRAVEYEREQAEGHRRVVMALELIAGFFTRKPEMEE